MNKKSQMAMEFLMTYGWAILLVLAVIAMLFYFGVLSPHKYTSCDRVERENITSQYERCGIEGKNKFDDISYNQDEQEAFDEISNEVCNNLIVNNNVYPFLKVMGEILMIENKAQSIVYEKNIEVISDLNVFKSTGRIFCSVPVELCFTENFDYLGGSYCMLWKLEIPVNYFDYQEWFEEVRK